MGIGVATDLLGFGHKPLRRESVAHMHIDGREIAAIFAGGFIGAIARAALADMSPADARHWPWATFIVNVVGAFLLGYATTRLQERLPLSSYRRPLLGTGFCGALTTFSTMQLELLRMLDNSGSLSPPATRSRASSSGSSRSPQPQTSCGGPG